MLIPLFKKIINFFNSFPEIGPRQAIRLFFWFLKQPDEKKKEFLENLKVLVETTKFCKFCFFPTIEDYCPICSNPKRLEEVVMVVARETDVLSMETAKIFRGRYFIVGGLILPFSDNKLVRERLKILEERLEKENIKEVILALPYIREAEPTLRYLENLSKRYAKIRFTKLARGLPTGGEIEFSDPETLKEALERRN